MRILALISLFGTAACATTGSGWMREGNGPSTNDAEWDERELPDDPELPAARSARGASPKIRTIGQREPAADAPQVVDGNDGSRKRIVETDNSRGPRRHKPKAVAQSSLAGKVLGTFRNTYYDFPSESDYSGERVSLYSGHCKPIAQVPRGFYEAVCVQGSGLLATGSPVSFNRRDCDCAELCPRTQQKICFDALELSKFPWGRGATGGPITPLLTVAVDTSVIPLGTALYIPEFEGLPRDPARQSLHDGCFVAQDRGLRVQGQHVDVFTGQHTMTELWNGLVPSNEGVTVVVDSPKCARQQ